MALKDAGSEHCRRQEWRREHINSVPKRGHKTDPPCRDKGHKQLSEPHLPLLGGGTGGTYNLALSISGPTSPFSFSCPWSCSIPLNLTINPPVTDMASWKGREAGAIYNSAVFTLRTRPFIPGHLPEAYIPLALYMGLSTGLCATSLPLRAPRKPGKPGGKARSVTLEQFHQDGSAEVSKAAG